MRFINQNVELAAPLDIDSVSRQLARLKEEDAMELLKSLVQRHEQMRKPSAWLKNPHPTLLAV